MLLLFAFSISSNIKKLETSQKYPLKYNKLCARLHQIVTIPRQHRKDSQTISLENNPQTQTLIFIFKDFLVCILRQL